MNVTFPSLDSLITWPTWTRNKVGENFYDLTSAAEFTVGKSNMEMAQCHPILTPAILFMSKLFSQAEFTAERVSTGKLISTHPAIKLLQRPNPYQTQQDFLETLSFMMIGDGVAIVWAKRIIGFDEPEALYVLQRSLIEWPEEIKNGSSWRDTRGRLLDKYIIYDRNGENERIRIKDLLFFYDLPNHMQKNPFDVKSRLDGLKQTLINTNDSLIAKNIILKSNGKELITGKKEGFVLEPDEKKRIEAMFQSKYGLGFNRKRGIITQADLTWKSLHIALRDLGLDESVKVDGNLIYTALHIPKDILSLEAKKTTYNNFKESMVSYIQNEMQSTLNSVISVLQTLYPDNARIKGTYEHMPIMQFILIERYDGVKKRAEALNALLRTGVPEDVALEMCGFERGLKLNPLMQLENNGTGNQNQTTTPEGASSSTEEGD